MTSTAAPASLQRPGQRHDDAQPHPTGARVDEEGERAGHRDSTPGWRIRGRTACLTARSGGELADLRGEVRLVVGAHRVVVVIEASAATIARRRPWRAARSRAGSRHQGRGDGEAQNERPWRRRADVAQHHRDPERRLQRRLTRCRGSPVPEGHRLPGSPRRHDVEQAASRRYGARGAPSALLAGGAQRGAAEVGQTAVTAAFRRDGGGVPRSRRSSGSRRSRRRRWPGSARLIAVCSSDRRSTVGSRSDWARCASRRLRRRREGQRQPRTHLTSGSGRTRTVVTSVMTPKAFRSRGRASRRSGPEALTGDAEADARRPAWPPAVRHQRRWP